MIIKSLFNLRNDSKDNAIIIPKGSILNLVSNEESYLIVEYNNWVFAVEFDECIFEE